MEKTLTDLTIAVLELIKILSGNSHGIFQGTHEAVVVEAQSAQLGPEGFVHIGDLQSTGKAIADRTLALNNALARLKGLDPAVGPRVQQVVKPILDQSAQYRTTIAQTEQMAADLARTNGTRLSGVMFGQGGSGPEIGRTVQALCSTQMQQRAAEFRSRGIEPQIIPSARMAGTQLTAAIRQLPIDKNEAIQRLAGVLTTVRFVMTNFANQAAIASRIGLQAGLTAISEALLSLGGRLGTPVIFINLRDIMPDLFPPEA